MTPTQNIAERTDAGQRADGKRRPPKKRTRDEAERNRRRKLDAWREGGGLDELKKAAAKRPTPRYAWEQFVKSPAGPPDTLTRVLLIFFADKCHDDRVVACPSVKQLAEELQITETAARHHLRLSAAGCWLTRGRFVKKFGTYEWHLTLAPWLHDALPEKFAGKIRRRSEPALGDQKPGGRTPSDGVPRTPPHGVLGHHGMVAPPPCDGGERYATSLSGGFAEGDRPGAGASPAPVPGGSPPPPDPGSQAEARGTGGRSVSGGWLRAVRLPLVVVVPVQKNHDNVRRRLATRCEAEQPPIPRASPDKARGPGGRLGPPGDYKRATPVESADTATADRQDEAEKAERRATSESATRQVQRDHVGTQLRGRVSGRPGSSSRSGRPNGGRRLGELVGEVARQAGAPADAAFYKAMSHHLPAPIAAELTAIAAEEGAPLDSVRAAMFPREGDVLALAAPDVATMTPAEVRGRWHHAKLSEAERRRVKTRAAGESCRRHDGNPARWPEVALEECVRAAGGAAKFLRPTESTEVAELRAFYLSLGDEERAAVEFEAAVVNNRPRSRDHEGWTLDDFRFRQIGILRAKIEAGSTRRTAGA